MCESVRQGMLTCATQILPLQAFMKHIGEGSFAALVSVQSPLPEYYTTTEHILVSEHEKTSLLCFALSAFITLVGDGDRKAGPAA